MKLKLRWTEQQDLFTGQSRESWELSSQINFSATQWDKSLKSKDRGRSEVHEGEGYGEEAELYPKEWGAIPFVSLFGP